MAKNEDRPVRDEGVPAIPMPGPHSTRKVRTTNTHGHRDPRTGRFARRPVPDVDAESRFDPMGDDIPFENVSGAPSANTTERPRYAPEADEQPSGGQWPLLHPRHPGLISMDEEARTRYGTQGMLTRDAARLHGLTGTLGYVLGLEPPTGPSSDVRQVTGDVLGVTDVHGDLRPTSRGHGRGRDR